MAYDPSKLKLIAGFAGDPNAMRIWQYRSQDAVTDVRAADYISNAFLAGMREGDMVIVQVENGSLVLTGTSLCMVLTVDADGADLADGTALTLTNN